MTVFASWNDVGFSAGLCGTADGFDYWEHLEERHAGHRRHVRNLVVICVVIGLAAIIVHPAVIGFGALVVPLLLIEAVAARRSRTQLEAPRSTGPHRFVD